MPDVQEHHIQVPRSARYATLGYPSPDPAEVWFVLHGFRQLAARFLRRFHKLDDGTRWLVAPEGLSRFYLEHERGRHGPTAPVGATWMTREDRETEIHDYVRYLDLLARHILAGAPGGVRVTVLGFSQGVHTAARWTAYGDIRPHRIALWGEHLPGDLDWARAAPRYRAAQMVLVRGTGDPALSEALAERERAAMQAAQVSPMLLEYEGGHEIVHAALRRLADGVER